MQEVTSGRQQYVRTLRRLIAEETRCTAEVAQVLRTLNIVIEQLALGRLHKLHKSFMVAKRRIRGVPLQSTARQRNQHLRKKLLEERQSIGTASGDFELRELEYVLEIFGHVLGVPPERTTLMPDKRPGTFRALLHQITVTGVGQLSATEDERTLVAA